MVTPNHNLEVYINYLLLLLLLFPLKTHADIFFPFEFLLRGWFFEFVNSVFEVIFIAGLIFFWLVIIDKIRKVRLLPCFHALSDHDDDMWCRMS